MKTMISPSTFHVAPLNALFQTSLYALLLCAGLSLTSCNGQKSDAAATTADSAAVTSQAAEPKSDAPRHNENHLTLGGHSFTVRVSREANRDGDVVTDENGTEYYDNSVTIHIDKDGEPLTDHTFTKRSFADFLSAAEQQGTVLLGMAFDEARSDAHALRFGAQIGMPGIEEGPAFIVEVPVDGGAVSIVRDKEQDTTGNDGMSE